MVMLATLPRPLQQPPSPPDTKPRVWQCTKGTAIYCPLHGDCTCVIADNIDRPVEYHPDCPLHGLHTNHPADRKLIT